MEIKKIQHLELANTANFFGSRKVMAGFLDNAKYSDGTSVASVAAQNEFGNPAKNIPSRPFFRNAIKANKQKWVETAGRLIESAITGEISESQALEQLGSMIKGDIQESILDGDFESLKKSTLVARQSRKRTAGVANKPLIDTGHMMRSVDYVVEEN